MQKPVSAQEGCKQKRDAYGKKFLERKQHVNENFADAPKIEVLSSTVSDL